MNTEAELLTENENSKPFAYEIGDLVLVDRFTGRARKGRIAKRYKDGLATERQYHTYKVKYLHWQKGKASSEDVSSRRIKRFPKLYLEKVY